MRLRYLYEDGDVRPEDVEALYLLLGERPEVANISHRQMPSLEQHRAFVLSHPYLAWYLIEEGGEVVGAIYLTRAREVGIHLREGFRGVGLGAEALAELRRRHPGRMLANIAPGNTGSIQFFAKHGARLIQHTYELPENA